MLYTYLRLAAKKAIFGSEVAKALVGPSIGQAVAVSAGYAQHLELIVVFGFNVVQNGDGDRRVDFLQDGSVQLVPHVGPSLPIGHGQNAGFKSIPSWIILNESFKFVAIRLKLVYAPRPLFLIKWSH